VSGNFAAVVVCDFEYEVGDGELPDPLCMVAHVLNENLEHIDTIKVWRGEFGKQPPFDIGPDTLFVAYSAWAEMTCFKVLGWAFPTYIFDQHTAYLAASNLLLPHNPDEKRAKPRKRLPDACRAYGLDGWENMDKGDIAKSIGEGTWREKYSPSDVMDYCEEDVRMEVALLRAQLRGHGRWLEPADPELVIGWSNYSAKAVALIQARGVPIDMSIWNLIQENKGAVIQELLRRFDPSHDHDDPIYDAEGGWSYVRFEKYLANTGVSAWPRKQSGELDIEGDTFRMMYHVPGIEGLHALRDCVGFIAKARMLIGRDGRNRCSLFPFGTATGRNAHSKSIYNAHAGMRSLMVFPRDATGLYLDFRTQEVGIAAALSEDEALKRDYAKGDIYHALALMLGLTDEPDAAAWKKQPGGKATRERMKQLQLGISYGMGVSSLARGLDRHPLIASHIIETHKRTYPTFWAWRANVVDVAMSSSRRLESGCGWPMRISNSPNERTLYNFPMQSGGADMLRLAVTRLCDAGIVPVMLVHDGILFEETDDEKLEHAKEIMLQAGRDVCDFEIGVGVDQNLRGGARYQDSRPMAGKMWGTVMDALHAVGAMKRLA
jgi:DNA polymerase-1